MIPLPPPQPAEARIRIRSLVVVILLATIARMILLDVPIVPNDEGTAAGIPICAAVNYARYGPLASRFAAVLNWGDVPQEHWTLYVHHPPLTPLFSAAVIFLSGTTDEWAIRLAPAVFSIASTAMIHLLLARRFSTRAAVLAAMLYTFAPITLAYGGMVDYINAQLVFFCLCCIECHLRFLETRRKAWLAGLGIAFLLGALSDWPTFYLAPLLGAHALFTIGRRAWLPLAGFAIATIALFSAMVFWTEWAGTDVPVLRQLMVRAFGETDQHHHQIGFTTWYRTVFLNHLARLHGWIILAPALAYIAFLIVAMLRRNRAILRRHAAPMLVTGLAILHLAVAVQGNVQHKWWSVLATPGLAVAAAILIEMLLVRFIGRQRGGINAAIPVLLLGAFMLLSIPVGYAELTDQFPHARQTPYAAKDLGRAIRAAAAPDEGVLTSDRVWEPPLWFYADRQLRAVIDSPKTLRGNLLPGDYQLTYGYIQNGGPAPAWFVLPAAHRIALPELTEALDAAYPMHRNGEFYIYDLRPARDGGLR